MKRIRRKLERRAPTRVPDPPCPECRSVEIRVTLRAEFALYYRCERCEHLWSMEKPGEVA